MSTSAKVPPEFSSGSVTSPEDTSSPSAIESFQPRTATGALVLADGSVYWGVGLGARGVAIGEVCFNTSLSGYQEILTDPSYAGQIITFTFPHVGNVGTTPEDLEAAAPAARGCILRADVTEPSNWRAVQHFDGWLAEHNLVALSGIDTRRLVRRVREGGAPSGAMIHLPDEPIDLEALRTMARSFPGLEGMDLAKQVTCAEPYGWQQGTWQLGRGYGTVSGAARHVVAVDFGVKRNILRCLAAAGCRVTVVPATTSARDILALSPDGVFLSNGPGDPAATGIYAVPEIKALIESGIPLFGICLGHQILALALGATTRKMHLGHRGGNQPVKDLTTGRVEITSQNHGFVVESDSLPAAVEQTHISLFDGSLEGLRLLDRPVFSVQYHPEASPGPHDSHYLFARFMEMIDSARTRN